MIEVAGGILLAIGALVLGLLLVRHLRVVGVALCAFGLLMLLAVSFAGG